MLDLLLVFLFNHLIVFKVVSGPLRQYVGDSQQKTNFYFFAFLIISLATQIGFYFSSKQANFYETLNIKRTFDETELRKQFKKLLIKYHPDKSEEVDAKEIFNKIQNMKNVLSNEYFKKVYDSFGEFDMSLLDIKGEIKYDVKYEIYVQNQTFTANTELWIFYMISFIILLSLTYDPHSKQSRKWLVISAGLFGGLDYLYISGDYKFTTNDPFDLIFPQMAIFQRILLNRLLLSIITCCIRIYFFITDRSSLGFICEQSFKVRERQDKIIKLIKNEKVNLDQLIEQSKLLVTDGDHLNQLISKLIENQKKEQENANNSFMSKHQNKLVYVFLTVSAIIYLAIKYDLLPGDSKPTRGGASRQHSHDF